MASNDIYFLRLVVWLGRTLGEGSSFLSALDTDAFGIRLPEAINADASVQSAVQSVNNTGTALKNSADALEEAVVTGNQSTIIAALSNLTADLVRFFQSLEDLVTAFRNQLNAANIPDVNERNIAQEFAAEFSKRIIDYIVINFLEKKQPQLTFLLKMSGLIEWTRVYEDPSKPLSVPYVKKTLNLHLFRDLISDPVQHLINTIGWGSNDFDPAEIFYTIEGFYAREDSIEAGSINGDAYLTHGSVITKRDSSQSPPGILVELTKDADQEIKNRININDGWGINIDSDIKFAGGLVAKIRPPFSVSLAPSAGEIQGDVRLFLDRNPEAGVLTIIGANPLLTISAENISFGIGLSATADVLDGGIKANPVIFSDIRGLTLKLGTNEGDGFLQKILSNADVEGKVDLGFEWTGEKGLTIKGSGGIEILIPIHNNIAFIDIDSVTFALRVAPGGILELEISATLTAELGPVEVTINRMGILSQLQLSDKTDSKYGFFDLSLGFKPPSGAGISIDAGGIKGGGILDFNPDKKEYFGALELEFENWFTLKAFGIINTRLPDGSSGFSLLIIITAEFSPIQLGYGFTLNGVGGLLGVNRTTKVDVLKEGLKTNTLKSILFPEDIVANINRIVSDIKQVFPPHNGRFLICPMGKIGWGASIITLELGILIEIPVTDIKILGVLKVILPNDKEPLLKLQVNFLGIIDFENKLISFDAFHYDSRLLTFTITGQMALRIDFRNDVFIISSGGFHPAFKEIPDDLTNMERITISLYDGENARIISQNYFAITSNTIQYGLKAELFAGSRTGFNIYGHISFDIIFKDIDEFVADFGAGVALRRGTSVIMGINVSGRFTGVSPLDIRGEASVSFFFFSVSVPFHVRIGNPVVELIQELAHLIQILTDEIKDDRNWIAKLPANNKLHVTTRTITIPDSIAVHPFGILCFSERIVPLEIEIKKFGYQLPKDANRFQVKINDADLKTEDATEQFAPANFFEMTDEEKLSRPSFEQMKSGFKITGSAQLKAAPHIVKKPVDYEFSYLGKKKKTKPDHYIYPGNFFKANIKSAAISQSSLSHQNNRVSINAPELVEVSKDRYVIANISDMKLHKNKSVANSYTEALQQYNNLILENPELKGQIQVLSEYELNEN